MEVESASGADTTITEDATVTAPTTGDAAPVAIYLLLAVMAIMMACTVAGKTFCVTGSLEIFANRNALIEDIQKHGGAFTSSVSSKTDFLISNDQSSNSGKISKAREYGVNIITENEYMAMTSE